MSDGFEKIMQLGRVTRAPHCLRNLIFGAMSVRFNKGFKTDKCLLNKQKGYFHSGQRLEITQGLELSCTEVLPA